MTSIEYRKARSDDYADIHRILNEGQSAQHIAWRSALFDWQYFGNPHSDGRSPFWVVTVDGEIGGVNGLMPVRIRYHGEPVLAVWSCDSTVALAHRGKGLGKGLVSRVSTEAEVVLGYGISDMATPNLARHGWELNPDVRGFFFSVAERGAKGLIKNARSSIARLLHSRAKIDGLEITARGDAPFDAEVDALWQACADGYASVVERDAAHLTWRYLDHPVLRYATYQARRHGELVALLIARPDATQSVIVDYCGPAEHAEVKAALIDAATHDLRRRGTKRIACETSEAAFMNALKGAGFWASRYRPQFRVRSNREDDREGASGWVIMTGDEATV